MLVPLIALTAALAVGQTPVAAGQEAEPRVEVTTSGDNSERVRTVPITRNRNAKKDVVMSLTPRKLPSMVDGDRLEISSELQVTPDCRSAQPTCVARPYRYAPAIVSRLMLATGPNTTGGPDAVPISTRKRLRCPHNYVNFVHHCRIVFAGPSLDILRDALPCAFKNCHVNFVLSAHSRRATPGDKLIIGANTEDGGVRQDRGRLNAVRFHPGSQPSPAPLTSSRPIRERISMRERRTVVLSRRLPALKRNAQLAVSGKLRVDVSHLPYDSRVSVQMILSSKRRNPRTSRRIEREAAWSGELSELNGSNCTQRWTPCRYPSVGVLRMRRDARDPSGRAAPRFVNFVVVANPKFVSPRAGDRLRVLRGSRLRVVRFPAAQRG